MIVQQYKEMLQAKSVIRELFAFATNRGKEIGYENVFDYSLGNPSVSVPDSFTRQMVSLFEETDPMQLHGYSPTPGIPSVLEKIAMSLRKRFGLEYEGKHIFMTSGAAAALAHAIRSVATTGDEIITFAPFFPEYKPYVNLTGAVLKVVPPQTKDFQIDFSSLEELINEKTAAILINTPNNPTGTIYETETLTRLGELLSGKSKEYGHTIYLISDEPYREIVFEQQEVPCVSKYYSHTIMCYSFSKSLSLPGERIGYVAVHPDCEEGTTIIQMCGQISRGIGHNCPASCIQLGVAEVLEETADLSVYEKNATILYEELIALGFQVIRPKGTFYIFPKALEEDATRFCEKAKKYDLVFVPGDTFGCNGYVRIAYCIDTEKVIRSLDALRRFVQEEYGKEIN
ncbi:MAG: pyridoxal phosphate-dependent aminotransferase [Eubacteriales bacterium]